MQKHVTCNPLMLLAAMLLLSIAGFAQPRQKPAPAKPDTSKGRLKLIPYFGAYTDGSKAFATDLKRLLGVNPQLKLKDEKGAVYTVVSFEITWKKKDVSDDVRTGKPKTVYYFVGGDITGNNLTDSWREEISNFVQKGEEITFSTILYYDPRRKLNTRAPSLVLDIQ
ncbi:MAG: hypothetical protein ABIX01_22830 [Chitinophagaceae bacterium]